MTRVISLRGTRMRSDGVVTRRRAGWHARWISRKEKGNIHLFRFLSCLGATLFFRRELFLPDGGFSHHAFEKLEKKTRVRSSSLRKRCRAAHRRPASTWVFFNPSSAIALQVDTSAFPPGSNTHLHVALRWSALTLPLYMQINTDIISSYTDQMPHASVIWKKKTHSVQIWKVLGWDD